jgi:palmitoyltransferase ZDHHC9/14/18
LSSDHRAPTIRSDTRHSSWGRRSGSWEIAPEILANSTVTESRAFTTPKEPYQ